MKKEAGSSVYSPARRKLIKCGINLLMEFVSRSIPRCHGILAYLRKGGG